MSTTLAPHNRFRNAYVHFEQYPTNTSHSKQNRLVAAAYGREFAGAQARILASDDDISLSVRDILTDGTVAWVAITNDEELCRRIGDEPTGAWPLEQDPPLRFV